MINKELSKAVESASVWKQKAELLRVGISEGIQAQLEAWGLSTAEQEVSFLLIKGLSLNEIADVRSTTEKTVRQQASSIYRKSGLAGRAQLSAYFLEDLLGPS